MRIRKKPWADTELNTNEKLIQTPEIYKGHWNDYFKNDNPIHIEIGCGKGQFIAQSAIKNENINYIAMERQTNIIVSALRKARNAGKNLCFMIEDAENLSGYFDPGEIKRIYINFCDPWHRKKKWAKRRLTHANFLNLYEALFGGCGEVFLKTDNKTLFEFSLNEFSDKGWRLKNISLDLHAKNHDNNIMTEYEEKFSQTGAAIYRCEAIYREREKL